MLNEPHVRFYAGCPLNSIDGSKLGTLCIIDHEPRSIIDDDLCALKDLALTAERELSAIQLATLDELTDSLNRRGFMTISKHSLQLCVRQNVFASLVFLDLNKFKSINDTFGHAEGDHALIVFSRQVSDICRSSDLFARLGGDEFAILFINASKDFTENIIARLRQSLDDYNQQENRGYEITFSHGIVEFDPEQPQTMDALLKICDRQMYEHKKSNT